MSKLMTSRDTPSATSLPGLGSGHTPCASQDGPTTDRSGQGRGGVHKNSNGVNTMNTFAQYATATAFAVQLSKAQCHALLWEQHFTETGDIGTPPDFRTLRALEARGLISWSHNPGSPTKFNGLTEAGRLMCQLLKLAGLTVENTRTASTLRGAA